MDILNTPDCNPGSPLGNRSCDLTPDAQQSALDAASSSGRTQTTRSSLPEALEPYIDSWDLNLFKLRDWNLAYVVNGSVTPCQNLGRLPPIGAASLQAFRDWCATKITFSKTFAHLGPIQIQVSLQEVMDFLSNQYGAGDFRLVGSGVLWWLEMDYVQSCLSTLGASDDQIHQLLTPEVKAWFAHTPNDFDIRLWFPGLRQSSLDDIIDQLELFIATKLPKRIRNLAPDDDELQNLIHQEIRSRSRGTVYDDDIKRWFARKIYFEASPVVEARRSDCLLYRIGLNLAFDKHHSNHAQAPIELLLTSRLGLESIERGRWQLPFICGEGAPSELRPVCEEGVNPWEYLLNRLTGNYAVCDPEVYAHDAEAYLRQCLALQRGRRSLSSFDDTLSVIALRCLRAPRSKHLNNELSRIVRKHDRKSPDHSVTLVATASHIGRKAFSTELVQGMWHREAPLLEAAAAKFSNGGEGSSSRGPCECRPINPLLSMTRQAIVEDALPAQHVLDALSLMGLSILLLCPGGRVNDTLQAKVVEHNGNRQLKLILREGARIHHIVMPFPDRRCAQSLLSLCETPSGLAYVTAMFSSLIETVDVIKAAPSGLVDHIDAEDDFRSLSAYLLDAVDSFLVDDTNERRLVVLFICLMQRVDQQDITWLHHMMGSLPYAAVIFQEASALETMLASAEASLSQGPYAHLLDPEKGTLSKIRASIPECVRREYDMSALLEGAMRTLVESHQYNVVASAVTIWREYIASQQQFTYSPTAVLVRALIKRTAPNLALDVLAEARKRGLRSGPALRKELFDICVCLRTSCEPDMAKACLPKIVSLMDLLTSLAENLSYEDSETLLWLADTLCTQGYTEDGVNLLGSISELFHVRSQLHCQQVRQNFARQLVEGNLPKEAIDLLGAMQGLAVDGDPHSVFTLAKSILDYLTREHANLDVGMQKKLLDLVHSFGLQDEEIRPQVSSLTDATIRRLMEAESYSTALSTLRKSSSRMDPDERFILLQELFPMFVEAQRMKASKYCFTELLKYNENAADVLIEMFVVLVDLYLSKRQLQPILTILKNQNFSLLLHSQQQAVFEKVTGSVLASTQENELGTSTQLLARCLEMDINSSRWNKKSVRGIYHVMILALTGLINRRLPDRTESRWVSEHLVPHCSALLHCLDAHDLARDKHMLVNLLLHTELLPVDYPSSQVLSDLMVQTQPGGHINIADAAHETEKALDRALNLRPGLLHKTRSSYVHLRMKLASIWTHEGQCQRALETLQGLRPLIRNDREATAFNQICMDLAIACTEGVPDHSCALEALALTDCGIAEQRPKILRLQMNSVNSVQRQDSLGDSVITRVIGILRNHPNSTDQHWQQLCVQALYTPAGSAVLRLLCRECMHQAQQVPADTDINHPFRLALGIVHALAQRGDIYITELMNTYASSGSLPTSTSEMRSQFYAALIRGIARHLHGSSVVEQDPERMFKAVKALFVTYLQSLSHHAPSHSSVPVGLELTTAYACIGTFESTSNALITLTEVIDGCDDPVFDPLLVDAFMAVAKSIKKQKKSNRDAYAVFMSMLLRKLQGSSISADTLMTCMAHIVPIAGEFGLYAQIIQCIAATLDKEVTSDTIKAHIPKVVEHVIDACDDYAVTTQLKAIIRHRSVCAELSRPVWTTLIDRSLSRNLELARRAEMPRHAVVFALKDVVDALQEHFSQDYKGPEQHDPVLHLRCLRMALESIPWLFDHVGQESHLFFFQRIKQLFGSLPERFERSPVSEADLMISQSPQLASLFQSGFRGMESSNELASSNGTNLTPFLRLLVILNDYPWKSIYCQSTARRFIQSSLCHLGEGHRTLPSWFEKHIEPLLLSLVKGFRFYPTPGDETNDFKAAGQLVENWGPRVFRKDTQKLLKFQYLGSGNPPEPTKGTMHLHRTTIGTLIEEYFLEATSWSYMHVITLLQLRASVLLSTGNEKHWINTWKRVLEGCKHNPQFITKDYHVIAYLWGGIEHSARELMTLPSYQRAGRQSMQKINGFVKDRCSELLDTCTSAAGLLLESRSDFSEEAFRKCCYGLLIASMELFTKTVELEAFTSDQTEWMTSLEALKPLCIAFITQFHDISVETLFFAPLNALAKRRPAKALKSRAQNLVSSMLSDIASREDSVFARVASHLLSRARKCPLIENASLLQLEQDNDVISRSHQYIAEVVVESCARTRRLLQNLELSGNIYATNEVSSSLKTIHDHLITALGEKLYQGHGNSAVALLQLLVDLFADASQILAPLDTNIYFFDIFMVAVRNSGELDEAMKEGFGSVFLDWVAKVDTHNIHGVYAEQLAQMLSAVNKEGCFPLSLIGQLATVTGRLAAKKNKKAKREVAAREAFERR